MIPLGFIYKTTNCVNGKIYVGKHEFSKDKRLNSSYLGSGVALKKAIIKYGKENFKREILKLCFTINQLNGYETYYIIKLKSMDSSVGYNMMLGGVGFRSGINNPCYNNPNANPFYGKKHTQETKNIISKKNKGKIPPNKGKKLLSEETRKKMSESAKRRMSIPENNPMYGKHWDEEHKQINREKHLGKRHSEESKRKMSEQRKGISHCWNTRKKKN